MKTKKSKKSSRNKTKWINKHSKQFDLSIFKEDHDDEIENCQAINDGDEALKKCIRLRRLMCSLKYYELLDTINNKQDKDIFLNFMTGIYTDYLDHFTHFITMHQHQLQDINNALITESTYSFKPCNVQKCKFTQRYNGNNEQKKSNKENAADYKFRFYQESMDSLHFYLYHLFDCGLRAVPSAPNDEELKNDDDDNNNIKNGDCFDAEFSRINKTINDRKHITEQFDRFEVKTKFSLY